MVPLRVEIQENTHTQNQTKLCIEPRPPLQFSYLAQRQAHHPYSFYKDENTINTVSRELEVIFIRAVESCAVITSRQHRGPWLQAAICIQHARPSSLLAAPSYLFRLSLSIFRLQMHFFPSHNITSTYSNQPFQVTSLTPSPEYSYIYYLVTFHLIRRTVVIDDGALFVKLSTAAIKRTCCLFVFFRC